MSWPRSRRWDLEKEKEAKLEKQIAALLDLRTG